MSYGYIHRNTKLVQVAIAVHVQNQSCQQLWGDISSHELCNGSNKPETLCILAVSNPQSKMQVHCLRDVTGLVKLAGIEWYNGQAGYYQPNCPCLAVVFDNGRAELRRNELDDSKLLK